MVLGTIMPLIGMASLVAAGRRSEIELRQGVVSRMLRLFLPYGTVSSPRWNARNGHHRLMHRRGLFAEAVREVERGESVVTTVVRHDLKRVMGTTADGSLSLMDTPEGLVGEVRPRTYEQRENVRQVEREGYSGVSCDFVSEDEIRRGDVVGIIRNEGHSLLELSATPYPAFPQSRCEFIEPRPLPRLYPAPPVDELVRHGTTYAAAAGARLATLRR